MHVPECLTPNRLATSPSSAAPPATNNCTSASTCTRLDCTALHCTGPAPLKKLTAARSLTRDAGRSINRASSLRRLRHGRYSHEHQHLSLFPPSLSFISHPDCDAGGLACACVCACHAQTSLGSSTVTTERPTSPGPLILLFPSVLDRHRLLFLTSPPPPDRVFKLATQLDAPTRQALSNTCPPWRTRT